MLGPTNWDWRPDVQRIVTGIERRHPHAKCNTYVGHPFYGMSPANWLWSQQSIDVWGSGGRGDAIGRALGQEILHEVFNADEGPFLRHYIWLHTLWTSFGGVSTWSADDHSGGLRHVHLTYW